MNKFGKFAGFSNPHFISAYDTTNQAITATGKEFLWKYNTTDISNGISIVDNTKITFSKDGTYNIQFSAQVKEENASATDVWVWFKKNGINIPNSTTRYTFKGSGNHDVIILNIVLKLHKGDYVEVAWSNSTTTSLIYAAESSSPTKPAIPSIILTVWEISSY